MSDQKQDAHVHLVTDSSNNTHTNPKHLESYLVDTIEESLASFDKLLALTNQD